MKRIYDDLKKSVKQYQKEKYGENQTLNIEYKKQSIMKILKRKCYIKNADTKKILKVK